MVELQMIDALLEANRKAAEERTDRSGRAAVTQDCGLGEQSREQAGCR